MKIAIGADFNAIALKNAVKKHLEAQGHEIADFSGPDDGKRLYLEIVPGVAALVRDGTCEQGILMCGTGMGMAILANKHKGVYAACCESVYAARKCRIINNANVLTMGAWIVGERMACDMADNFIQATLGEGLEEWRQKNVQGFYEKTRLIEDEFYR